MGERVRSSEREEYELNKEWQWSERMEKDEESIMGENDKWRIEERELHG